MTDCPASSVAISCYGLTSRRQLPHIRQYLCAVAAAISPGIILEGGRTQIKQRTSLFFNVAQGQMNQPLFFIPIYK